MDYRKAEGHEENPRCPTEDTHLARAKEKEEMSCFWSHKWSEWSNIITKQMMYEMGGQAIRGVEHIQQRTCSVCNEVQQREV